MYFGCVCIRGEIGFRICDIICMCVVNKQFELLEFFFITFLLTCSMMRFLSLLLLGLCPCVVLSVGMWSFRSACEVVVVPYVEAVVVVTVMRVSLVVLHVCLLRECDGARLMAMLLWGMDEGW